jgi:hypothetical protein
MGLWRTPGLAFYVHVTVHCNKFLFNKTNKTHEFPKSYFVKKTLRVTGISFAHHQEFSTVHSTMVYFLRVWMVRMVRILLGSCHQTCEKYTNAECTVEKSWWWAKKIPETCRVFWQNKIWEICASSWFIKKKLVWHVNCSSSEGDVIIKEEPTSNFGVY